MWYKLDEQGEPVKADDAEAFGDPRRIVAQDELAGDVRVSTVFLVLDHGFGDGPPVLWETMTFGLGEDDIEARYTSREAAIEGHRRAFDFAKEWLLRQPSADVPRNGRSDNEDQSP